MSKKLFIFIIIGVALIGIVGFVAFRLITAKPGERGLRDILPFGRSPETTPTVVNPGEENGGVGSNGEAAPGFGEAVSGPGQLAVDAPIATISKAPVSGLYALARGPKNASTSPIVRYVERATGHLYEADLATGRVVRLTNTTIPKIYEALFVERGEGVVLRYLQEGTEVIQTWYGKITPPDKNATSTDEVLASLQGKFLPEGVSTITVSPGTDRIFYLLPNEAGANGFVAAPNGSGERALLTTQASEWLLDWPVAGSIVLTTKPSSLTFGSAFELSPTSGAFKRLAGDKRGFTMLANPGFTATLVGASTGNSMTLAAQALKQKPAPAPIPAATLPEKCIWSKLSPNKAYCAMPKTLPAGEYPDAWYQGRVSFSDNLWLIDTAGGAAHLFIADLEALAEVPVDGTRLALDPEERYLYLINKIDGSLVAVRLKE